MNKYDIPLINRCKYLERVNANLRETVISNDRYIEVLREDIRILHELIEDDEEHNRTWIYQNDGYDNINGMCSDLPVLIQAGDLQDILRNGETISPDFQD